MPINMRHCRYENTLSAIEELEDDLDSTSGLSDAERRARDGLLLICQRIVDNHEAEIEEIATQRRREREQRRAAAAAKS